MFSPTVCFPRHDQVIIPSFSSKMHPDVKAPIIMCVSRLDNLGKLCAGKKKEMKIMCTFPFKKILHSGKS